VEAGYGCVKRFGQVAFDEAQGRLSVGGRPVELDRPCLGILALLVREAGKDVGKDHLLRAGWPHRFVHENSLAKAISRLRHSLGDDGHKLETVHSYGYRLAAEVEDDAAPVPVSTARTRRRSIPTMLVASVLLIAGAAWGLLALSGPGGPRQVINGEPPDSVGRILWVDDHPENNVAERRYLQEHKIGVYQVSTTEDALTLLGMYAYGAVVSDMGRADRPLAGTELLEAMRARGDRRPFILYTVYSSNAQRKLIADSGGQGVAETRDELYAAILPLFGVAAAEE
jgi:DNA-binding response OmpR family regulator